MNTKYVFLDIDGTLVDFKAEIPPSALKALKTAQANGHKMIIASGRPHFIIYKKLLEAVKFDGIIASGGSCVIADGEVIFQSVIEGEALQNIVDYFKKEGIYYILQAKDATYVERDFIDVVIPGMLAAGYSQDLIDSAYSNYTLVEDITKIKGAEKMSFFGSPNSPSKISDDLGGRYYVVDYSVGKIKSSTYFGELNNAGVNKATAIEQYIKHVGGSIEDTIAIGDSGNDLEMINFAHIGVAMGNATEPIKAAADFTTTAVDDDGIYNAFVRLGLI